LQDAAGCEILAWQDVGGPTALGPVRTSEKGIAVSISNRPSGERERLAERRLLALRHRQAGASYRKIGAMLGISVRAAYCDCRTALRQLAALQTRAAELVRIQEDDRLDHLLLALQPALQSSDPEVVLRAIGRAVQISAERRKLWGADMPVAARDVQVVLTPVELAALADDDLDRLLARLDQDGIPSSELEPCTAGEQRNPVRQAGKIGRA
jgi:hypothetical protein